MHALRLLLLTWVCSVTQNQIPAAAAAAPVSSIYVLYMCSLCRMCSLYLRLRLRLRLRLPKSRLEGTSAKATVLVNMQQLRG